jgi:hypothetical protein
MRSEGMRGYCNMCGGSVILRNKGIYCKLLVGYYSLFYSYFGISESNISLFLYKNGTDFGHNVDLPPVNVPPA